MDFLQWVILIVLIAVILSPFLPAKGVTNISPQEAREKLRDKNVQFIDVRTPGEYRQNHVPGFQNIPLFDLPNKINKLDKNKEVVVICQSGMRSKRACNLLRKHGFAKIYNVRGGMNAWR